SSRDQMIGEEVRMKRWLVSGVETEISWPANEFRTQFRGHEVVLRPETDSLAPNLLISYQPHESFEAITALAREFLSVLCWVKGDKVRETLFTGGTGTVSVGKGPQPPGPSPCFRLDYLPEPMSDKARLALALFREAVNVNSVAYKFLGFYKVINLLYGDGSSQKTWINRVVSQL